MYIRMTYNKEAVYKFKVRHPDEYKAMTKRAAEKWNENNLEYKREKDRLYKRFRKEWERLRNIDVF
jgi:hypothetical protein